MADSEHTPTWAQRFTDCVWSASPGELTPVEAMVLLAYARHARRGDSAWLTQRRLMEQCKMVSMSTAVSARRAVIKKGWLAPVGTVPVRGGTATEYRLVMPLSDTAPVSLDEQAPAAESDTPPVSLDPVSDTDPVSLYRASDTAAVSGQAGDTAGVSLANASDTAPVSLDPGKRYTVHSKAIQSGPESDTAAVSRLSDSAPPGGGVHGGAHADAGASAGAHTREGPPLRGPSKPTPASMNGRPVVPLSEQARASIAMAREQLANRGRRP